MNWLKYHFCLVLLVERFIIRRFCGSSILDPITGVYSFRFRAFLNLKWILLRKYFTLMCDTEIAYVSSSVFLQDLYLCAAWVRLKWEEWTLAKMSAPWNISLSVAYKKVMNPLRWIQIETLPCGWARDFLSFYQCHQIMNTLRSVFPNNFSEICLN